MRARILVIHNDSDEPQPVACLVESLGFEVVSAERSRAVETAMIDPPHLVLLDVGAASHLGRELCREVRSFSRTIPILVMSAEVDVVEKVLMFEAGADDYMTKPCSPRELLARVRVALRRAAANSLRSVPQVYSFDEIEVNFDTMELHRAGQPVAMTRQEFKMLQFFLSNKQRVLSRNELLNQVWGYQSYPTTRTVDTHVFRLRRKLERDPVAPVYFQTVHGTGYKFVG